MNAVVPPWLVPLTDGEHALIMFGFVAAGFALFAMLTGAVLSRREVGPRYRPATHASIAVVALAFGTYALLTVFLLTGYSRSEGLWRPGDTAIWSWALRYADWAITVPLLVLELIGVSALGLRQTARVRIVGMAAGLLMVLSGFLGGVVIENGTSATALTVFGIVGAVFFAILYGTVFVTVLRSLPTLPLAARRPYRAAMILLFVVWFAYPVVYGLQGAGSGGAWTATEQLLFCAADVVVKIGFSLLIIRVAKLRTAADVLDGIEFHPETIWVDRVKHADATLPPQAEPLLRRAAKADASEPPNAFLATLLEQGADPGPGERPSSGLQVPAPEGGAS